MNEKVNKNPKITKKFRLAAKKLLLTYPKCDIDLKKSLNELEDKLGKYHIKEYLIVKEDHEDGNKHLHAYVEIEKRIDIDDPRYLDLTDNYHGDYRSVRNKNATIEYLTKDIFDAKTASERLLMSQSISDKLGEKYELISLDNRMLALAEIGNIPRAMELLRIENPSKYITQGTQIERRLKEIMLNDLNWQSKYPWPSFQITSDLNEALGIFKSSWESGEVKVLILEGPPGCGKTQALLAYFEQVLGLNVLVVNEKEALRYFDPTKHGAILFDDPDLSGMSREELINLIDYEKHDLKIRYGHVRISQNTPKAFSLNIRPKEINRNFNLKDGAIGRRSIYAKLGENVILFNPEITINIINNNNYFVEGASDSEKEQKNENIRKLAELNKRCQDFNKRTLEGIEKEYKANKLY